MIELFFRYIIYRKPRDEERERARKKQRNKKIETKHILS